MNCRPGDLAFIVGLDPRLGINGKPVQLTNEPPAIVGGMIVWKLTSTLRVVCPKVGVNMSTGEVLLPGDVLVSDVMADPYLRPIRGGDVSDDEVRELYATSSDEVAHG